MRTETSTNKLIGAYTGYVHRTGVGDPVMLHFEPDALRIAVQPKVAATSDPVAVLSALLLWCRGLDEVTATWWRTRDENLHISIDGRLGCGVRMHLYSGFAYRHAAELVYLEPNTEETATLDELCFLAAELHTNPTTTATAVA